MDAPVADRGPEASHRPAPPGVASGRIGPVEALGVLATLLWAGAVAALWRIGAADSGAPAALGLLVGSAVPVALIWIAVFTARSLRSLRDEAAALRAALAALQRRPAPPRAAAGPDASGTAAPPAPTSAARLADTAALERRLDQLLAAQRRIETALAEGAPAAATPERKSALPLAARPRAEPAPAARPAPSAAAAPQPAPPQAMLALGHPAVADPPAVTVADFLSALNFPDSPHDRDGFAALHRALQDARAARLIRAAQDALTLLSEDGIYMDDHVPAPTPPALWRRFARGARGEAVAGLGAIDAPDSLGRATLRMREDAVFRDAAHHFLRHFDRTLEAFEPVARDEDLVRMADSRSGRAFMLLGRVAGIFG